VTTHDDTLHTVTFLPWLRLQESVEINGVVFWPFPMEIKKFDPNKRFKHQLQLIFRGYKDPTGKPTNKLTVASFHNEPFKDLTNEKAKLMTELVRLLAFSVMAENQYYRQGGRYFNSTHFQHMHQRFRLGSKYIAPHTRRRDSSTYHGGYKHGELKFSIPLQAWGLHDATPNISLLHSLDVLLDKTTADAAAVRQTINWYLLANGDSESVSVETEMILMGNAFEALFQIQDTQEKKAALMDRLPNLFSGYLTKKTRKAAMDGSIATRSWKIRWIDEFYWLRSKIIHGGKIDHKRMVWNFQEHLTIAAIILQIAVKLVLANKGSYSLSSDDAVFANGIDHFIANGKLSESKLVETRENVCLDIAVRKAWDTLHPKK
jgi:hypothetical protein